MPFNPFADHPARQHLEAAAQAASACTASIAKALQAGG